MTKVLVAYEYRYRVYREVIARGISNHRPHLQVRHTGFEELERELHLFDPQAVVSSQPNGVEARNTVAWVELPVEPSSEADICLDGNHVRSANLTLVELLSVLDEAEALVRREDPAADGCRVEPRRHLTYLHDAVAQGENKSLQLGVHRRTGLHRPGDLLSVEGSV